MRVHPMNRLYGQPTSLNRARAMDASIRLSTFEIFRDSFPCIYNRVLLIPDNNNNKLTFPTGATKQRLFYS